MCNNIFDIIVIGLGPAGIGFANSINSVNNLKVGFIDKGEDMFSRKCEILSGNPCMHCNTANCKMIHGVGGASLLGGHKISSFPAGTFLNNLLLKEKASMLYYQEVLDRLADLLKIQPFTIKESEIDRAKIFYRHLGYEFKYYTSYLCSMDNLKWAYNFFIKKKLPNVDLFLNSTVYRIDRIKNNWEIFISTGTKNYSIVTKKLIIAVGRSGTGLLCELNKKFNLGGQDNHMELGIRLEFPTRIFESIDQFHNDLKLMRENTRTFCISKNGRLAPYFCKGMYLVDGFFDIEKPTSFTNLALMLRLNRAENINNIFEYVKDNMDLKFRCVPIIQDLLNFSKGNSCSKKDLKSSISFLKYGSIKDVYPPFIYEQLKQEIQHFVSAFFKEEDYSKINIIAPAIEYFWPDFPIKDDFSVTDDLYLIGDCTGKYRGILQAFVSGALLGKQLA